MVFMACPPCGEDKNGQLDAEALTDPMRPVEMSTKPGTIQFAVLIHSVLIVNLSPLFLEMRLLTGSF